MSHLSPTRRDCLRTLGVLVGGVTVLPQAATATHSPDDVIEYRAGSTDKCRRFVKYETTDGEEFESCIGPDGGFVEEVDDDGDEERTEFDRNGIVRYRRTEEEDGDEEEWIYDGNGTLRVYREEEEDDDEEERIYDVNGTLRFQRTEDDDGDERERWYDETGTLRVFQKDDEDGDDVRRVYDANGILIESDRDDDDFDD
ncbi:hypothetical protein [Halogeometricum borinquense]|uniref:hypothetical protein n=1 Tax=Halogeometricum borinquense TaxID=60847 RepID=UPI001F4C560C|nr:hypothetical protein [Halogeometricum borinquense]